MIPSIQEIIYRVMGAWQLARFDAGGAQYFDESRAAAVRSFFAAALVLPTYVVLNLLLPVEEPVEHDELIVFVIYLLDYVLTWTAFPVIAYYLCQSIDRESAFFRFLSATNWANLISIHLELLVVILLVGGIVPETLVPLVAIVVYAYLFAYQWFVTRHCLNVSAVGAAGITLLYFAVTILVSWLTRGLL